MTDHLYALGAIAVSGATIAGSSMSHMVADATGVAVPDWLGIILGPLGSVACLVIALKWLAARVDKSEQRTEVLRQAHAEKLETLTHAAMKVTDRVSNSLDALVAELKERPCGMKLPPHRITHETEP